MNMKIGIVGCAGRMGQELVQEVFKTKGCQLSGGTEGPNNVALGADVAVYSGLPECGMVISEDTEKLFGVSDVIIDFTLPVLTAQHLKFAQTYNTSMVLGTTGHDENEFVYIEEAAKNVTIIKAMNFSIGVNALFALTEQLSNLLDDSFDIEIFEMHHRYKVDAPSGTAIALGEAAAKGRSVVLNDVSVRGRDGLSEGRKSGEIGFTSSRGGEVVGDHSVIFAGDSERIELIHKAGSRSLFSKGAVFAALWTSGQPPGLYDMLDVLGFKKGT
jgi:4-hydroxy-tetrahydrodipicolinate reductase